MRQSESEANKQLLDQSSLSKQEALKAANTEYLKRQAEEKQARIRARLNKLLFYFVTAIEILLIVFTIKYMAGK